MRTILAAILLICVCPAIVTAQDKKKAAPKDDEYKAFVKVEIEGHPDAGWAPYLQKESKLPDSVAKTIPSGSYTVRVAFIVDIYGSIIDVKAENDPGYGLAARAIKTIKNYKGKWTPANQCGRSVKAYKRQSITYVVSTS